VTGDGGGGAGKSATEHGGGAHINLLKTRFDKRPPLPVGYKANKPQPGRGSYTAGKYHPSDLDRERRIEILHWRLVY
jgi:hypothetical protein